MRLNNLPKSRGAMKPRKRLGRGHGSGHGKTSGRGHKGQKARAGSSQRPGFESGHIPLFRRIPKRGFNQARFQEKYAVVNVSDLEKLEGVEEVDREVLVKAGLVRRNAGPIKVLGNGNISKGLKVKADKFSGAAAEKIKAAGGEAIAPEPAQAETSEESSD